MLRKIEINTIDSQPQANNAGNHLIRVRGSARGLRVHAVLIALRAGAGILPTTAYGDIRTIVDEKQRRVHTLAQLDDQLSLRKPTLGISDLATPGATVYGLIQFSEFDRKQYVASERFALDLLPGTEMRFEVDSTAQAAVGAVSAFAFVEDLDDVIAEGQRLGLKNNGLNQGVMEWVRTPVNYNGTEITINNIQNNGILYGLSLYNPGGEPITRVEIDTDRDGAILKRTKAVQDIELNQLDMFPQPSRFDVIPDATDNPRHALDWSQYGRFDVKVQTANAPAAGSQILTMVQKYVPRG